MNLRHKYTFALLCLILCNFYTISATAKPTKKPALHINTSITTNYPRPFVHLNKYHKAYPNNFLITSFSPKNLPEAKISIYYLHVKTKFYDLLCELGDKNFENQLHPIVCKGNFPNKVRKIFSIRINDFPKYSAMDNYYSENRDTDEPLLGNKYRSQVRTLHRGFRLELDFKSRVSKYRKNLGFKPSFNTCIHTYDDKFTCKNVYNHGFIIDKYGVYYF